MLKSFHIVCIALLPSLIEIVQCRDKKFEVAYEWNYVNYTWQSPAALKNATDQGEYAVGEDVIVGIRIYRGVIYLALPRIKSKARITLASININSPKNNSLLSPYPSWEMNTGEECSKLQNVQSLDIDEHGIMWVLDARRVGVYNKCPPKIVLLDLNNNGKIVQSFKVPDELCPHNNGCFLNDIVQDGKYSYMSDTTQVDPGILVYNRQLNRAWKFRDNTMHGNPTEANFTAQGVQLKTVGHINGIALSPKPLHNRRFYYMPQSSKNIFSIDTSVLKMHDLAKTNIHSFIQNHGTKQAQSGGMICDSFGNIYYGLLPLDAVGKWNISKPLHDAVIVETNHGIIKWPDSFAFDDKGYLYVTTNSIAYFSSNDIDFNQINFRILRLHTGTRSYNYGN